MIAAREGKSLSECNIEERIFLANELTAITCTKFVDGEEAIEVCGAAFDRMVRIHPKATLIEVHQAYSLAASGTIEFKLFREISFAQMSEVYKLYVDYGKNKLSEFFKNQISLTETPPTRQDTSEQQKARLIKSELTEALKIAKNGGFYDKYGIYQVLYDHLREIGKINLSEEERESWWYKGREYYISEVNNRTESNDPKGRRKINKIIEEVSESDIGKDGRIINRCKLLILNDYLKKQS